MGELKDSFLKGGEMADSWYQKNKSHFWTGMSMVGTLATAFASATDTNRIFRKSLKEHGCDPKELPMKKRLQLYATNYIPTAVCAGASMFGAGKSDHESGKLIAERTSLYLVTRKSYDALKKNLAEAVGEKKAQKIQDKAVQEEAAKTVTQERVDQAPTYGRGDQVFLDEYSGIIFKSNIDYLRLCEAKLQNMMADLAPRNSETDYYDQPIGVRYMEWLAFIGVPKKEYNTPERRNNGWNKGFAKDGSDDDEIEFYTTPAEYEEGKSCLVINWRQDPTDMRLGRLIKGSEI